MNLDTQIFYAINGLAGMWTGLDEFMRLISRPWTYVVPSLLAAAFWYRADGFRSIALAAALAALVGLADATAFGVKQLITRPRPCQVLPQVTKVTGCGRAPGFPSNHAVNTAGASVFLQMIYPRTGWITAPVVMLIGFNRIYVGAHYPSDVVGGWLLGVLDAWLFVAFLRARRWLDLTPAAAIARR